MMGFGWECGQGPRDKFRDDGFKSKVEEPFELLGCLLTCSFVSQVENFQFFDCSFLTMQESAMMTRRFDSTSSPGYVGICFA